MSELKIGDKIICANLDEARKHCDAIEAEGFEYCVEDDFRTGEWTISIIGKREHPKAAADKKKDFDMDEAIADLERTKRPDESICFGFGVGRMMPLPWDKKSVKKGLEEALKYIKKLEGFFAVHPIDIYHNILVFDTLNNAKGGRNLLKSKDVPCGDIVPILIKTQYLQEGKK